PPLSPLDPQALLAAVLQANASTADARLRHVLDAAILHLHAFALEVDLTPAELQAGLDFLVAVGQASGPKKHEGILLADILGLAAIRCRATDLAASCSRRKGGTRCGRGTCISSSSHRATRCWPPSSSMPRIRTRTTTWCSARSVRCCGISNRTAKAASRSMSTCASNRARPAFRSAPFPDLLHPPHVRKKFRSARPPGWRSRGDHRWHRP